MSNGVESLSPWTCRYLQIRLNRSDDQIENDKIDPRDLNRLINEIPKKRLETSISKEIEFIRNSTYEGPSGSNYFDCYMEREIRPLEDNLAEACFQQEITPQEAIEVFCEKYIARTKVGMENLRKRIYQFEQFINLEEIIRNPLINPEERYEDFIGEVTEFLHLKNELLKSSEGTPDIYSKIRYFHKRSIYAPLSALVDNFKQCENIKDSIDFYLMTKEIHFNDIQICCDVSGVRNELSIRYEEAKTQLKKMIEAQKDVPSLPRLLYGEMQEGVRRTPTKTSIETQILDHLDPIVAENEGFPEDPCVALFFDSAHALEMDSNPFNVADFDFG